MRERERERASDMEPNGKRERERERDRATPRQGEMMLSVLYVCKYRCTCKCESRMHACMYVQRKQTDGCNH